MNCEGIDCKKQATQILSIGTLGRYNKLCPFHVMQATLPLDAALTPYTLTGLEAAPSAEQSLAHRVDTLDDEKESLLEQIADARRENDRLKELLFNRLEQHNADLRAELEALKAQQPSDDQV